MQALYGVFKEAGGSSKSDQDQMVLSIDRIYELYISLLFVIPEVLKAIEIDAERIAQRWIKDGESNSPHEKIITNEVIQQLGNNRAILAFSEKYNVKKVISADLAMKIFTNLKNSNLYASYKAEVNRDFEVEKAFIIKFYRKFIFDSEELVNLLEEENIHWIDDMELAKISVMKTINGITSNSDENHSLMKLYKDDKEDSQFALDLFKQTIKRSEEIQKMLVGKTQNWDEDRIAFLDNLLMKMAISEVLHFASIPIKVSINEYIEIAKKYSTPKSGAFINGILDNVIGELDKAKKIKKTGRGLIK